MPYLQLDVNGRYPRQTKRALTMALCETYADLMDADIRRITVAIRECGDESIWRLIDGEPTPVAILMCDIRRGRTPDQRMKLAEALTAHCEAALGLPAGHVNVEFTQHDGDEMYHPMLGGYSPEWAGGER